MRMPYLLFFFTLSVFGQENTKIEVLAGPKTPEDYEHQYKGCPENSECDQVMGLQMTRWKELIEKIKSESIDSDKKIKYLELFRAKYGIPVEFYTDQKSQQGFKPLLFNSHCKEHNPKEGPKILKGTAFLKSMGPNKAVVWRDQTQIEVPTGELLNPQPVTVYRDNDSEEYLLPIGDQPLFIKNKDLYVLKEEDDFFYFLKISPDGEWKIENVDMTRLSEWEEKKSDSVCPKDKTKPTPKAFGVEFCRNIWDEDLKKSVVVKMHQGCLI